MEKHTEIRLIVSDLDGTLFNGKKEILPYTEEVIKKAIEQGICFVPSTGRPITSVTANVLEIPGISYMICSNGAAIYTMPEKKRIYEKILTRASMAAIRKIPRPEAIAMEAFIQGEPYAERKYVEDPAAFGATPFGVGYIRGTRTPVDGWEAFMEEHEAEFDSVSFASQDHEALVELRRRITEEIPEVYAIWSFKHLMEVGNREAGKGETLLYLMDLLNISKDEAIAFGDAENDLSMIQAVKYGIAMGNATEDVKKAAYAVTDSNEEDGIGKFLTKKLFSFEEE